MTLKIKSNALNPTLRTEDSEKNHPPADLKTTNSDHNGDKRFLHNT
jgi:hypothetical protein